MSFSELSTTSLELQQLITAKTVFLRDPPDALTPPRYQMTTSAIDAGGNPQITRLLALSCVSTKSITD